jgi:hypothetical protein
MSDEPKERSRAWMWAALAIMLVFAYPLSMGPAMDWADSHGHSNTVFAFYRPLFWAGKWPAFHRAMNWYLSHWNMYMGEP